MSGTKAVSRQVSDLMAELGVRTFELEQGRKHLKLRMVHAGRSLMYVLSGSPSDRRAWANTRSGVRRLLRQGTGCSSRSA